MPTVQTGTGNVTSSSGGAVASIIINKPANVADGDLLIANVRFQNSGIAISAPAGWSALTAFTTNWSHAVFYKAIPSAAAETASTYTFSAASGTARFVGTVARATGADLTTPFPAVGTYSAVTGTTSCTIPAVTAPTASGLLLAFEVTNLAGTGTGGVTSTPPGSMTTAASAVVDNGAQMSTVWMGQQALTATGTTGARVITHSPAASNSGGFLAILAGTNTAPTVTGVNQGVAIEPETTVTLVATMTSGVTADSYTWRQIFGPAVTFTGSGNTRSFAAPSYYAARVPTAATVLVGVTATVAGVTTPERQVTVDVLPQQSWYYSAGQWWGRRPPLPIQADSLFGDTFPATF